MNARLCMLYTTPAWVCFIFPELTVKSGASSLSLQWCPSAVEDRQRVPCSMSCLYPQPCGHPSCSSASPVLRRPHRTPGRLAPGVRKPLCALPPLEVVECAVAVRGPGDSGASPVALVPQTRGGWHPSRPAASLDRPAVTPWGIRGSLCSGVASSGCCFQGFCTISSTAVHSLPCPPGRLRRA